MSVYTIAIHGGAGTIERSDMSAELEQSYMRGLEDALAVGYDLLSKGNSAMDAVRAAVVSLENNILFNAGKGSVFAKDGSQEMDASIMDGSNTMAGAVSAVKNIANPVELAYAVMTGTPHVMLNGQGAMDFAKSIGMPVVPDEYFYSDLRYQQWKKINHTDQIALDHNVSVKDKKFGTVGAVACDQHGNIAGATSTGGMTNKQWGRVGDSSIIGSGTYANNKTCAISCTGHGEMFIRAVAAYDVSCLMEYKGYSLQQAMDIVVHEKLMSIAGEGGMVGVDAQGNGAMVFNSTGMYRGMKNNKGLTEIKIYR